MGEKAQVARYAEIVARLARPLADREAVLWLARLDENGFARLQTACLSAVASNPDAAVDFSRAFARTTLLLEDAEEALAPTAITPATSETPASTDLAVETDTVPLSPAASADALYTLASATHAMSPRKRREPDER